MGKNYTHTYVWIYFYEHGLSAIKSEVGLNSLFYL